MKQHVNLYRAVLYPVYERFGLSRLVASWLVLVAALIGAGLWIAHQQQQLQTALAQQQQQNTLQQQEISLYQQALTQRQPSAELVKQYQDIERRVAQKQQLLSFLAEQQMQASQIYSPVMQHLNKVDRPELWLTSFSLQQQYSSFNGIALRPDSVPLWLEDLRQLSYFHGQRFRQVTMQQVQDKRAVSFKLLAQQGTQP
ncbi:PilN domain-containing protein [Rheinheimera baltica]|uniref:PilN domain-containing protein n=1 Tax=Rheinheimera baltica TaxID=67576 RepID=UPI00273E1EB1|nr:PilN domain-containing protein [Rheinheimera baltica]MDP5142591.1 PilN domain-containing protein [Rheinheimera baltica]MDP5151900.1 PilN domain-containing protein [Rheinheimera baltica]